MVPRRRRRALSFAIVAVLTGPAREPAAADPIEFRGGWHGHHGRHHRHDHDAVRAAVARGEIRPLAQLLDLVKDKLAGEIAGVEIERWDGVWLYEFRIIDKEGRLFDVYVDAQSGEIKRTKEK